jgi:DNA-binding GntR family transcriptional regulator
MPEARTQPNSEGEVERVYRLLKSWILDCTLKPGDFLSEIALARDCNTSRTPIREACGLLSQEGWVHRIRHKGYLIPLISVRDIVEIYEYRRILECFTTARVAADASPPEIENLRQIIAIEDQMGAEMADVLRANEQFHLALARLARNQRVYDQLKLTLEYVHRLDILSTQRESTRVSHREIMRAIESGDQDHASKAMEAHVAAARDRMLKLFST